MDRRLKRHKRSELPTKYQYGFLSELDQRSVLARELHQRLNALMDDLGGASALSYQQRALCERAVFLELWLQREEAALARGEDDQFNVSKWTQAANALQGIFGKLGLERRARDANDLNSYLRQKKEGVYIN